jgi:glycosyltransferase involved in cell wall biosynthesis
VIGTPAGAAPELLAHGGGTLVPAEDPEAMAQALVRLVLLSDRRWREISENAYRTATSYTWDDATDRMESTLEQILQSAAHGPQSSASIGRAVDTLMTTKH